MSQQNCRTLFMDKETDLPSQFRQAMSRLVGGVVIVCAQTEQGSFTGFTATSFVSVSVEPCLTSFNISRQAGFYQLLRHDKRLSVSILNRSQADTATLFASGHSAKEDSVHYMKARKSLEYVPPICGANVALQLSVRDIVPAGDSAIVIASVIDIECFQKYEGLCYVNRSFASTVANPVVVSK